MAPGFNNIGSRAYPNETSFTYPTVMQAFGLTQKHYNRLERLEKDKHSSLLKHSYITAVKSFITLLPELK
jgi:hypothetical protein